jgi:glycerol-3-phosphate dehydrogenase
VRPLAVGGGSTITLSREHAFHKLREGVFAAVGGKYTTHRVLARDYFCFIFGKKKKDFSMGDRAYPGSFGSGGAEAVRKRLEEIKVGTSETWTRWIANYGSRALELAEFIAAHPDRSRLLPGQVLCEGEVRFSAEREHCRTAVDFFRRRTGLYFTPEAGVAPLAEVERLLAETHGMNTSLLGEEGDYRDFLKRHEHRAAI